MRNGPVAGVLFLSLSFVSFFEGFYPFVPLCSFFLWIFLWRVYILKVKIERQKSQDLYNLIRKRDYNGDLNKNREMATRRHTFSGCRFLLHSSGLPTGTLRPMKKWLTADTTVGNTFVSPLLSLQHLHPGKGNPGTHTKLSV